MRWDGIGSDYSSQCTYRCNCAVIRGVSDYLSRECFSQFLDPDWNGGIYLQTYYCLDSRCVNEMRSVPKLLCLKNIKSRLIAAASRGPQHPSAERYMPLWREGSMGATHHDTMSPTLLRRNSIKSVGYFTFVTLWIAIQRSQTAKHSSTFGKIWRLDCVNEWV